MATITHTFSNLPVQGNPAYLYQANSEQLSFAFVCISSDAWSAGYPGTSVDTVSGISIASVNTPNTLVPISISNVFGGARDFASHTNEFNLNGADPDLLLAKLNDSNIFAQSYATLPVITNNSTIQLAVFRDTSVTGNGGLVFAFPSYQKQSSTNGGTIAQHPAGISSIVITVNSTNGNGSFNQYAQAITNGKTQLMLGGKVSVS